MHLMMFFISETTKNKSFFPPETDTDIQGKGKKHKKHSLILYTVLKQT